MSPLNLSFANAGAMRRAHSVNGQEANDALDPSFHNGEQFYGTYHIIRKNRPIVVLLVFLSCAVGALLRTVLKETKIPILVIIFVIGLILGIVAHFSYELPFVKSIAEIDPVLFLHLFTPVIIFTASFEMDFYIFRKSFWQSGGSIKLVHPQSLMDPEGFQKVLGEFLAGMVGAPVEDQVTLWNGEMAQTVDTIAPKHLLLSC
ncbi:Sodium/hydrogen exchanger 10 [Varanus komodoensis]|nr:Sodium/hydrogen exchanger 10 [Varanus komodoensis]